MSINSSYVNQYDSCIDTFSARVSTSIYAIIKVFLILPLCILVLFVGHQRWRQRGPGATLSSSDILTYHMVAIEILNVIVAILNYCITFTTVRPLIIILSITFSVTFPGQLFYHCLTSIDRYLAVVHPIIYLRLRNAVKIIYISSGFALLLCSAVIVLFSMYIPSLGDTPLFSFLVLSLVLVSFCSLSVLHALQRPGPGEGGRANQFKQRAFYTTMAIMVVLLVWFVGTLVGFALSKSKAVNDKCLPVTIAFFFSLPSNMVIPLLFLHRVGKLPCCFYNSD